VKDEVRIMPQSAVTGVAPVATDVDQIASYECDLWFDDAAILTDRHALLSAMREAAAAGAATVLSETSEVFPNQAVTAVLVLAESHLSVHTWPEHRAATFDLLTCGRTDGERILDHLRSALAPVSARIARTMRDLRRPVDDRTAGDDRTGGDDQPGGR
jgi:S-adenosylmethionine decarboxylase